MIANLKAEGVHCNVTLCSTQVPVLVDGDTTISDSWRIAEYLEDNYTAASSLFGSFEGRQCVALLKCHATVLKASS